MDPTETSTPTPTTAIEVPSPDDLEQLDPSLPSDAALMTLALIFGMLLTSAGRALAKARPALSTLTSAVVPTLAVLLAVFVRAVGESVFADGEMTWAVVQQGIVAGGGAVFAHAQWRSLAKHLPALLALLVGPKPPAEA